MGRKNKSINRPVMPDSKYNSTVISKFVCLYSLEFLLKAFLSFGEEKFLCFYFQIKT